MYDTSPYSSGYSTSTSSGDLAIVLGFIFFLFIIFILVYVVNALFLGKIFNKAGVESWKAWVPVLNNWKMLEIGGQQGFWSLLAFLPIVNIVSVVFLIIAMHNINKKMGYDVGMTFLAVLLPIVWIIILGTSKNQWNDSLGAPRVDQPDMAMPYPAGNQPYPPQNGPVNAQTQHAPYGPPPATNYAPGQNQQPQQNFGPQQTAQQPVFTQAPVTPQPHQFVQQPVPPLQDRPYQSPQPQLTEQQPVAQAYPAPETVVDEVKSAEEPITDQPVGESVDQQPTDESADQQSTETKPPTY